MATLQPAREFTGRQMLIWIVSFFAVIIAVNLTMAFFANSTWSGLIVKNGYVASQTFDEDLARSRAQEALGWSFHVSHDAAGLIVEAKDRAMAPLAGLTLTGELRRPATDKNDQSLVFTEGAGTYAAAAQLAPGVWELTVTAQAPAGETYRKTYRFFVKG